MHGLAFRQRLVVLGSQQLVTKMDNGLADVSQIGADDDLVVITCRTPL